MQCSRCGRKFAPTERVWRCPCGGALDLTFTPARLDPETVKRRAPDLWRYREALPIDGEPVSLGETMTPLVPFRVRGREVLLKCDFVASTGSYKDRGAAILMTHLRAIGVTRAVEDSSGNAAAALAAYAARAGIALTVFCPASASPAKISQIRLYGAAVRAIEGPRPRATEALLAHVEATGEFYASHLWIPHFVEGVKTVAYEIAEQSGWRVPDVVVCPVGAGSILLGLHRGFRDLVDMRLIERMPRLFAAQSANVSPVHRAWSAGADDVAAAESPRPTMAEGIALPKPVRGRDVLTALRESGGGATTVTEDEIREGLLVLGRGGIAVEPTSAVVVKALERLEASGAVRRDERVVLVLSGSALKAMATIQSLLPD